MTSTHTMWEPVAELESMQECKEYIKGGMLKDATGNSLCAFLAKGVYSCGTYWVKVTSGVEHTPILAKKTRKNSCATSEQLHDMKLLINAGAKPASILSTFTSVELDRCKQLGEVAPKRIQGGLVGEL
eukprot:7388004-Prymnesium_polylepis.3